MFTSLRNVVSDEGYLTRIGHADQLNLQVRLIRSNTARQPGTISIEVTEQSKLFYIENHYSETERPCLNR